MLITLFNSHAITNRILIIVLEGTLRHEQTHKNNSKTTLFGFFNKILQIFMDFRIFMSKHTKTAQNGLKTLKNSKEQVYRLRVIKSHEFASKHFGYPPTLKSNIVLNVSSIKTH